MTGSIHTLSEGSGMLKAAEKTVCTMAQKGQFPAFKVRGQWRFKQDDTDRWIDEQKAVAKENAAKDTLNV